MLAEGSACATQARTRPRSMSMRPSWRANWPGSIATCLVEPGRALVANAGVLLMRVLYVKDTRGKTFVVTDAAMNDFLRPALYNAVHPITHATRTHAKERVRMADAAIVGPVARRAMCFLHSWPMLETKAGDLLLLWGAGAYGFCAIFQLQFTPAFSGSTCGRCAFPRDSQTRIRGRPDSRRVAAEVLKMPALYSCLKTPMDRCAMRGAPENKPPRTRHRSTLPPRTPSSPHRGAAG